MSGRYGRNQRRQAREKIARLESEANRLFFALQWAEDRAKPFDARRRLIDRIAGQFAEEARPVVERLIRSDERGADYPVPIFDELPDAISRTTIMQVRFDLRAAVQIEGP